MKTINIKLLENEDGTFKVLAFTNTVELRVGMTVKRNKVEEWTCRARVQVSILGKAKETIEDEAALMEDVDRADVLKLADNLEAK